MASSCQPASPPAWPIAELVVDGLGDPTQTQAAQRALRRQLENTSGVRWVAASWSHEISPTAPTRLRVALAPALLPATGTEGVLMQVEVGALVGTGRQFASTVALHGAEADLQALREGFGRAWAQLERQRQLDDGGEAVLAAAVDVTTAQLTAAALADDDDALLARAGHVAFALRRIAERHVVAATPQVCAWLAHADSPEATAADRAVALHAVGTLVALGDPRAVASIIALAQHKDAAFVLQLAYAVAALGGPLAEGYLVTLAGGHLDDAVRDGAATALDELLARKQARSG